MAAISRSQTRYRHARAPWRTADGNFKTALFAATRLTGVIRKKRVAAAYYLAWLTFNSVSHHHVVMAHADTGVLSEQLHQDGDSFVRNV